MRIIISNSADAPIYEQIENQIKEAIFSGQLTEGEMLPSIRSLARDLHISVITTTRAYNDLEREGLVTSVQGKGFYVLKQNHEFIRENALKEIERGLGTAISAARTASIGKKELESILDVLAKEEHYE